MELGCEAGAVLLLLQRYGPAASDLRHALLSRGRDQNRCFAAGACFSAEPGRLPFRVAGRCVLAVRRTRIRHDVKATRGGKATTSSY